MGHAVKRVWVRLGDKSPLLIDVKATKWEWVLIIFPGYFLPPNFGSLQLEHIDFH